jgi:hypothetical protein
MIKWLSSKIIQWGREYNDMVDEIAPDRPIATRKGSSRRNAISLYNEAEIPRTFRFDVSVGRGGIVLVTKRYDPKRDENTEVLHVIHDNDDVANSVGQIVAMEMLK